MIIPITSEYRNKVNEIIEDEWDGPIIISKGTSHDTKNYNGFISVSNGELTGYILYHLHDKHCEILLLQSFVENQGIGSALIKSVMEAAQSNNCVRVWLITTNDNIHTIQYYQRFRFELK